MRLTMLTRAVVAVFVTLLLADSVAAQTAINNTVFSTAVTTTTTGQVSISSATCTGCTFGGGTWLYADGEVMIVAGSYVSGTTNIPVLRGQRNTVPARHTILAKVWVGPAGRFHVVDPPYGSCNKATDTPFYPWINIANGFRWLCDNATATNYAVIWRATVPWQMANPSDATSKLQPPRWEPEAILTRLERVFAW